MNNLFVTLMVIVSVILVTVILLQPDKSQTVAKTESILDLSLIHISEPTRPY